MLRALTDTIVRAVVMTVGTRVAKIVKIGADATPGSALPTYKVDVDARVVSPSEAAVALDSTEPVTLEQGRYAMVAIFVRLP